MLCLLAGDSGDSWLRLQYEPGQKHVVHTHRELQGKDVRAQYTRAHTSYAERFSIKNG